MEFYGSGGISVILLPKGREEDREKRTRRTSFLILITWKLIRILCRAQNEMQRQHHGPQVPFSFFIKSHHEDHSAEASLVFPLLSYFLIMRDTDWKTHFQDGLTSLSHLPLHSFSCPWSPCNRHHLCCSYSSLCYSSQGIHSLDSFTRFLVIEHQEHNVAPSSIREIRNSLHHFDCYWEEHLLEITCS